MIAIPLPASVPSVVLGLAAGCLVLDHALKGWHKGQALGSIIRGTTVVRQLSRPDQRRVRGIRLDGTTLSGVSFIWLAWLAGAMLRGPLGGSILALVIWVLRWIFAASAAMRRRHLVSVGVRGLTRDLYLLASGGDTAVRCLARSVERAAEPVRGLLAPVIMAIQTGQSLYVALASVRELANSPEYLDLLQIAWLHVETGTSFAGMLAESVERAEESALLRGELDAKMGEARWTARILAVVPVAVVAYMAVFSPFSVGAVLRDPTGAAALATGSVMWVVGLIAVWRMQVPPADLAGEA